MFRIQMQTTKQMIKEIRAGMKEATGKTFSDERIIHEALKIFFMKRGLEIRYATTDQGFRILQV